MVQMDKPIPFFLHQGGGAFEKLMGVLVLTAPRKQRQFHVRLGTDALYHFDRANGNMCFVAIMVCLYVGSVREHGSGEVVELAFLEVHDAHSCGSAEGPPLG